jgi:hypothetical protein
MEVWVNCRNELEGIEIGTGTGFSESEKGNRQAYFRFVLVSG